MKYLSLFSGIGGFELGIGNKGECVGYSEIDKYAIQIYEKHWGCTTHPKQQEKGAGTTQGQSGECTNQCTNRFNGSPHKNYGDITTINADTLPDFDLLCGGFPCQSFSIAGKRGGFEDTRGTLFFDIARILKTKQPRLLLLENVKGLLSHDSGKTFTTIIKTLDELGYDLQWQVLNSKNFGVPQNRERVFIIGHLRGTPRPKVFPITETSGVNLKYEGAIMSEKNKQWLDDGKQLSRNFPQGQRVYSAEGISATLASQAGGLGAKTGLYCMNPKMLNFKRNKIVSSITATNYKEPPVIVDTKIIRRLTPIECERLQGFRDGWTEGISDTQRYKCLGNAVTVNVIQAIAERLLTKTN